jgi:hypothetical protein
MGGGENLEAGQLEKAELLVQCKVCCSKSYWTLQQVHPHDLKR